MKGYFKVGVSAGGRRRSSVRRSFTDWYFMFKAARRIYRFFKGKPKKVRQASPKEVRLRALAQLREGIPPGDSITILCGAATHRVVHDRSGYDITTLVAYVCELPLARSGIAMHEYELMKSVVSILVGDHEVTFDR